MHIESDLRKHAENAVADAENLIAGKLQSENLVVEKEIIPGSPKQMIVDESKEFGADLVVVGSHGYGFMDRLILGSVSNYVLHNAPCSVLVVRSEDKESGE
jgi:nucleotide-binding universal stress UspA family protein